MERRGESRRTVGLKPAGIMSGEDIRGVLMSRGDCLNPKQPPPPPPPSPPPPFSESEKRLESPHIPTYPLSHLQLSPSSPSPSSIYTSTSAPPSNPIKKKRKGNCKTNGKFN